MTQDTWEEGEGVNGRRGEKQKLTLSITEKGLALVFGNLQYNKKPELKNPGNRY